MSDLDPWLKSLAERVPDGAPVGTRHRIETAVGSGAEAHWLAAEARIDRHGQRRERFWCDGVRLQRHELLRLACPETACPQARALRVQWQAFLQRRAGRTAPATRRTAPSGAQPLMHEARLEAAGQVCAARPATFRCYTPCAVQAHPPMWMDQPGWDLFEDGVCIAGGLVEDGRLPGEPARPLLRPRFPTLRHAHEWLAIHAQRAVDVVTAAARRR